MTVNQEDALYDFLENVTEPFSLDDITAFIRMVEPKRHGRLGAEIGAFIDTRRIAFPLGGKRWISRRGCFEGIKFVINPTRLELTNGIFIPGHRCIPFANPVLMPHEYTFRWKGNNIPVTTTEGAPEDFYPFYTLFGEEYAPQYVARDNPENEESYNLDPYEDPPEVSIHTFDMRKIYLESSFVPGDHLVVSTVNWKEGIFEVTRTRADEWTRSETDEWIPIAEEGFKQSFEYLSAASSTEEQIAFAYWLGGIRMRSLPAWSLEEFLFEKTESIETVPYGIETRLWYAGKDIPDRKELEGMRSLPDRTMIEEILYRRGAPVSEYVVQSYIRDALFRGNTNISSIIERIIPKSAGLEGRDREYLADYILEVLKEFSEPESRNTASYSRFADTLMGPIRQRVGELHTAVLELAAQLQKSDTDSSWLPKHTFVVLSQIQGHAASILEDLDTDEAPPQAELEAMDNSLDSMIDTYEDIKDLINDALDSYRKNNISLIRDTGTSGGGPWRTIQISLGGTDIWRRLVLPDTFFLSQLRPLIRSLFEWDPPQGADGVFINANARENIRPLREDLTIGEIRNQGISEFLCEFGTKWTVKIIILARYEARPGESISCVAGAGAAPPRFIDGPLRFRRFISALDNEHDYDPERFDLDSSNRAIRGSTPGGGHGGGRPGAKG